MNAGRRGMPRRLAALGALAALLLGSACTSSPTTDTAPTDTLEVVSWWTSGSEQAALKVLFDDYAKAHPGIRITSDAVAGGGGSNVQVVLATRLRDKNPPDVWQTFVGASVKEYARRGLVTDVSSVYAANGLATTIPKVILDSVTMNGKQWGVPTGSHRSNVLFYNTKVLSRNGITAPTAGYSLDALLADLRTLRSKDVVPLCLGGKDAFASAELFENTLLSTVGTTGWSKVVGDTFDWSGPDARTALRQFGALLDNADPAAGGLSWDQATQKLAKGQCAFESFNDSAYGELVNAGAVEGTDFGAVAFPGTDTAYLAVVDTFVTGVGAKNGKNALDFLTVIGTARTETAFNTVKGSVPLRRDADVQGLPPYEKAAFASLHRDRILLSIVHGEAMSPAFQQGFYDAVRTYATGRDARAFARTLSDAVNGAAQVPAAH